MTTKKTFAYLLVLPAMLVTLAASATEFDQPGDGPFFGETANGKWLVGVKYVDMNNSDDGIGEEESRNAGIILGYEFARPVWKGKAAFEFQYLPSIEDGDVNGYDSSNPSIYPAGGTWENPVYSGYMAYRTAGRLYLKGKVGIVASRFKINTVTAVQAFEDNVVDIPVLDEDTMLPTFDPITGEPIVTKEIQGKVAVGPAPGTPLTVQENKTQIGYGMGIGMHITKRFDIELEYEGNQGKAQLYNFGINAILRLP